MTNESPFSSGSTDHYSPRTVVVTPGHSIETRAEPDVELNRRDADESVDGAVIGPKIAAGGLLFNLVVPLLLLLGGAAVVLALGAVESEQRTGPDVSRAGRLKALPAVRVAPVRSLESTDARLHLNVEGNVVPFRESKVAAEIAGRIVDKSDDCEAGNFVRKGQMLMQIDKTDYQLEVQRLTRQKEQDYQAIQEVDQEMVNTNRLIEVAERDVVLRQQELDRLTSLPDGFASRAEIDQAERGLLQARQQQLTLQNQVDLLRKRRVRLQAAEKLAATQLQAAEVNLERTTITAPIDGVIVSEQADVNTFVSRGSTLVTIEDVSKVEVACRLRMDQLYWILDQRDERGVTDEGGYDLPDTDAIIEYQVSGRNNSVYRWQGRLLRYDGIGLDPATRTVPVRVVVDRPQQYVDQRGSVKEASGPTPLVRGMYVQVKLLVNPQTPLVVVPASGLRPGNRVWQFVADESVLASEADSENGEELDAPQGGSTTSKSTDEFIPDQWVAGRVIIRRAINPVDSLAAELAANGVDPASGFGSPTATSERWWVCEIGDASINDGGFVVVSPLGSIDDEGLAARARATELEANAIDDDQRARGQQASGQPSSGQVPTATALVRRQLGVGTGQ